MATPFYALVYGNEWEDIVYFSDLDRAKAKLQLQAANDDWCPVLYEYHDRDGVYVQSTRYWMVHPKDGRIVEFSIAPN